MATKNFPSDLYMKTIDTGTDSYIGVYSPTESIEVAHMVVSLFKKGPHSGSEQFRLRVYEDAEFTTAVMASNTIDVSDIPSLTSSDWLGTVRFDFDRQNLIQNQTYFIVLEPVTYTRNLSTFYFSSVLDWPVEINDNSGSQAGSKVEIWGYK